MSPEVTDLTWRSPGAEMPLPAEDGPAACAAPNCLCESVRGTEDAVVTAQPEFRRIAVTNAFVPHVHAVIEDGKIHPAVAVEIGRGHVCIACEDGSIYQLRRVHEATVFLANKNVEGYLGEPVLRNPMLLVFFTPTYNDIITAVSIDVGDGNNEVVSPLRVVDHR